MHAHAVRARRSLWGRRASLGLLLGLVGACAAPYAAEAADIAFAWDDCRSGGGAALKTSGCGSDFGSQDLFASFMLDEAIEDAIGVVAVIDVQLGSSGLPDWWALQSGGCRVGELDAIATFTDRPDCADPWADASLGATALLQGITPTQPRGGANQMRIYYAAAVPSAQAVDWAAGTTYHAVRLRLSNAHTTGVGACSGCTTPACIVLNGVELQRLTGPDVVLSGNGSSQHLVNWQGTSPDCAAVPVVRTSWGALRSLYR